MAKRQAVKSINKAQTPIIVGEPNNYTRAMICDLMRNLGYTNIFSAANAAEIIDAAIRWNPKVILFENLLPDMSGTELARRIRREDIIPDRTIPLIMITGDPDIDTVKNARMAGIDEFAAKPVSYATIDERMNEVLLRPRPFIVAQKYVGPCRRRKRILSYMGAKNRASDQLAVKSEAPEAEYNRKMMQTYAEKLASISANIDKANMTEIRNLFNTVSEAHDVAVVMKDRELERTTRSLIRYMGHTLKSGQLQGSVIHAHVMALRMLLNTPNDKSNKRQDIVKGLDTIVANKLRVAA